MRKGQKTPENSTKIMFWSYSTGSLRQIGVNLWVKENVDSVLVLVLRGVQKSFVKHIKEGILFSYCGNLTIRDDPNAIAVLISVPHTFVGSSQVQIGYIKAGAAKGLAAEMDSGIKISGYVKSFYAPDVKEYPRVQLAFRVVSERGHG